MIVFTDVEIFHMVILIITIVISQTLSWKMIYRYFKYKVNELLYVGLTFIISGLFSYIGYVISFLLVLTTGNPLELTTILLIWSIVPFSLIFWIIAFTNLVFQRYKKLIVITSTIFVIIFEIIYYITYFNNPNAIGEFKRGHFMVWFDLVNVFFIIFMSIIMITGFLFVFNCLRSENKLTILKGKFLFLGLIFIFVSVFLEAIIITGSFLIVIARVVNIIGAVCFYIGFVAPNFIKKLFIKDI